jgi:uncharacterized protein YjdB
MQKSRMRAALAGGLAAGALLFAGCGGSSGTVSFITVTPTSVSVSNGSNQQFTATATNTDNSTHDVTGSASWSSSNPAAVSVSSGGLATALASGGSAIIATSGGVTGNSGMTVNLTSLFINSGSTSVVHGQQVQISANGTFSDGTFQDVTSAVSWSTSNSSVATVSTTGLVTTIAAGPVTITATSGTFSSSAALSVQ